MPRGDFTGPDGKGPKTKNKGIPSRDGRGKGRGKCRGKGRGRNQGKGRGNN